MVAALGGLDVEVVAIALLFALLVGVLIVRPLLVALANNIPVVGPSLGQGVDNILNGWLRAITPAAQGALGAFSSTVAWLDAQWRQLSDTVVGFAQLVGVAVTKIETYVIPHAVDAARSDAEHLVTDATSYLESRIALERADLTALVNGASLEAGRLFADAETYAVGLADTVEADARALVATAETDAAALVAQEHAFAVSVEHIATGYADGLFSQAIRISAAAEAALQRELGGVAGTLARDLEAGVSALEQQISKEKAALAAATSAVAVAVAIDIEAIRNSRCFKACDVLGAAGEGLQLLDLAAILALAEAAQTDPKATQKFLTDNVAPVVKGIADSVRGLA